MRSACVQRHKGAYVAHVLYGRGVPAADVLVERRRRVKRLPSRPHAVHTAAHRTVPAGRATPRHAAAPYIAFAAYTDAPRGCYEAQPRCNTSPCRCDTRSQLSQASPTSTPGLALIRSGPSPHLHWGPLAAGTDATRRTSVCAPHACNGTRARTLLMSFTDAVFQLPMFWLNADAE